MERRLTTIQTTLARSVLALTIIAPWALGQDPDTITEIRRLAEQGDAFAQYDLADRYANGLGVLKDAEEALRWWRRAAEQGHSEAQYSLGLMHSQGRGVHQNPVLAHMWFNIAGANGNEAAGMARDALERDMSRDEINLATALARECMTSDYQACESSGETSDRVYLPDEPGVSEPVVMWQVQPEYSEEARKARYEGVVRLDAIIHKDGSLQVLRVLRGLDFGLHEQAIEAVEQWKFRPALRYGEPVAVSMQLEVTFNLR